MPKLLSLVRETAFQCSNITSTLQSAFLDYVLSTLLPVQSARIDTAVYFGMSHTKEKLTVAPNVHITIYIDYVDV